MRCSVPLLLLLAAAAAVLLAALPAQGIIMTPQRLVKPANLTYGVDYGIGKCMDPADCVRSASTRTVTCNFNAAHGTVLPDGFARDGYVINGKLPGPCIEAEAGDTILVWLTSDEPTTIHWHGFHHRNNQEMDGTPLTQCSTIHERAMLYNLTAEIGTHWWHSHVHDHGAMHTFDGMFGPMIVRDPQDPYKSRYTQERIFMVQDWFHDAGAYFYKNWNDMEYFHESTWNLNTTAPPTLPRRFYNDAGRFNDGGWFVPGPSGDADDWVPRNWTYGTDEGLLGVVDFNSGIINGKGQSATTAGEVVQVTSGATFRLRIIHSGSMNWLNINIQDHTFTIIASDGANLKESKSYKSLHISPGERFDILVTAATTAVRKDFAITMRTGEDRSENNWFAGTLRVQPVGVELTSAGALLPGDAPQDDSQPGITANCAAGKLGPDCHFFDEERTIDSSLVLPSPDIQQTIAVGFSGGPHMNSFHFLFPTGAGKRYIHDTDFEQSPDYIPCPPEPCPPPSRCYCTQFVRVPGSKWVGLLLNSTWAYVNKYLRVAASHPMHLHGHRFHVLAMGVADEPYNPAKLNFNSPPEKDTVVLPAGGWVAVMFYTDNPGAWFFHCHMDIHLAKGMGLFFDEAPEVRKLLPYRVHSGFPLCDTEDFERRATFTNTSAMDGEPDSDPTTTCPAPGANLYSGASSLHTSAAAILAACIAAVLAAIMA